MCYSSAKQLYTDNTINNCIFNVLIHFVNIFNFVLFIMYLRVLTIIHMNYTMLPNKCRFTIDYNTYTQKFQILTVELYKQYNYYYVGLTRIIIKSEYR